MRELLFRGKREDNGEWVYGYYGRSKIASPSAMFLGKGDVFIEKSFIFNELLAEEVILETVSEFCGLTDKNGKKIFEGDIVKTKYGRLCVVEWRSTPRFCGFDLMVCVNWDDFGNAPSSWDLYMPQNLEIVGNIYDNPNLLNKE